MKKVINTTTYYCLTVVVFVILFSCNNKPTTTTIDDNNAIQHTIDQWHLAASEAKFDTYFKYMSSDAVFIGTDPTEYWTLKDFKTFCKPYFDKGKAWHFTSLQRHIYFNQDHSLAWFDELLNTQMKICRGSGVLRKENNEWKIAHYVLSMTVPNDYTNEVVKLKTSFEDLIIDSLNKK